MGRPANDSVNCSINNIYQLEGRVPIGKAIPFGLQHILAMFVSNLAPITIIAGAAQPALSQAQVAILLQNAMFVAGIATLIQLYPIWRLKASCCYGREFYLCNSSQYRSRQLRISGSYRRGSGRRYF